MYCKASFSRDFHRDVQNLNFQIGLSPDYLEKFKIEISIYHFKKILYVKSHMFIHVYGPYNMAHIIWELLLEIIFLENLVFVSLKLLKNIVKNENYITQVNLGSM